MSSKPPSFKSRYKLHGIIAAVALMWIDFAVLYRGLVADDPVAMGAGMVLMIAAVGVGYFFG